MRAAQINCADDFIREPTASIRSLGNAGGACPGTGAAYRDSADIPDGRAGIDSGWSDTPRLMKKQKNAFYRTSRGWTIKRASSFHTKRLLNPCATGICGLRAARLPSRRWNNVQRYFQYALQTLPLFTGACEGCGQWNSGDKTAFGCQLKNLPTRFWNDVFLSCILCSIHPAAKHRSTFHIWLSLSISKKRSATGCGKS